MDRVLYGVVINQAADRGDLVEMKQLAEEARRHIDTHGEIRPALERLEAEITKLEAKGE